MKYIIVATFSIILLSGCNKPETMQLLSEYQSAFSPDYCSAIKLDLTYFDNQSLIQMASESKIPNIKYYDFFALEILDKHNSKSPNKIPNLDKLLLPDTRVPSNLDKLLLPDTRAIIEIAVNCSNHCYNHCSCNGSVGWPRVCIWENGDVFWNLNRYVFYFKLEREIVNKFHKIIQSSNLFDKCNKDLFVYCDEKFPDSFYNRVSIRLDDKFISLCSFSSWWKNGFFSPNLYKDCYYISKPEVDILYDLGEILADIDLSKYEVYVLYLDNQKSFWWDKIGSRNLLPYPTITCLTQ